MLKIKYNLNDALSYKQNHTPSRTFWHIIHFTTLKVPYLSYFFKNCNKLIKVWQFMAHEF